jgi:hypothetical protein
MAGLKLLSPDSPSKRRASFRTPYVVALTLSLGVPSAAQEWKTSFVAGVTDPDSGVALHATEVRQMATFGSPGKLYAATSGWFDQASGDQSERGAARVIRLDGPDDPWRLETDFNTLCTTPAPCALAVGAIQSLNWKKTESGTAVNVWTLVASSWPMGPKPLEQKVYVKNNNPTDGKWYASTLNSADKTGHIRVFDTHLDAASGQFWGFAGGTDGVWRGQLSNQRGIGQNIIHWQGGGLAGAEADFSSMTDANCIFGPRVLGLQEARGSEFLAVCYHLYKRVDGDQGSCKPSEVGGQGSQCSPRWVKFWDEPFAGTGEGLRGLTKVTINSKEYLLVTDESATARVWQVDPDTGNAFVELDIANFVESHWNSPVGYIIPAYNSPMPIVFDKNGIGKRLIGMEIDTKAEPLIPGHSKVMGDADKAFDGNGWFLVRNAASSYELMSIPAILPQTLMLSVRAAQASPFPSECDANGRNCWVYFSGFDANSSTTWTPCRAEPCAFPPLVRVQTHDVGWIVKGKLD